MAENRNRSVNLALLVGWLATAMAVAVIPVLLIRQDQRSELFWHRIMWAEFLAALVWGYFGGALKFIFQGPNTRPSTGGILPATGFVVIGYAALSFLLMVLDINSASRFHTAAQVGLLAAAIITLVFFGFAHAGAVAGAEAIPDGLASPSELGDSLRFKEEKLWPSGSRTPPAGESRRLHEALKMLRETLEYSLPHVGRVGRNAEYSQLAGDIQMLCRELEDLPANSPDSAAVTRFVNSTEALRRRVENISAALKAKAP